MKKEITKTSELLPQKRNANRGTERGFQVLENSLRNLGFGRSIVVDRKGRIIGGNHTTEKAVEIGLDNVVTVRTKGDKVVVHVREDLDFDKDSRAAELAIADNRTGELNLEWDAEILAAIKEHGEVDLSALGFTDKEVNEVLKEIERDTVDAPDAEIDRAEELLRKWKVKPGDIWEVASVSVKGKAHRLMCGDSVSREDVLALFAGTSGALLASDPPYNVNIEYGEESDDKKTTGCYKAFCRAWFLLWEEFSERQIVTPGGNNLNMWCRCFSPYHVAAWTKTNSLTNGKVSRWWCWEPILFFGKGWIRRRANDVFDFPIGMQTDTANHPCPKPLKLWTEIIEMYSEPRDIISDAFVGAGTTLVAAERSSRICYGMEIEPKYVAVSLERLSQMGLLSKLIKPGQRKR